VVGVVDCGEAVPGDADFVMDIHKIIADLRKQRDCMEEATMAIEKIARQQSRRRGRPRKHASRLTPFSSAASRQPWSLLVSQCLASFILEFASHPHQPEQPGFYRLPDRLTTIRDRLKLFHGQMKSLFRASHLERQPEAAIINFGELENW